ncbi:hypothetical protein [Ilumatobacter sp.]|uniref:hypothetical protein n=1 Tax=Ilumatobacter sp. TaxID=1967498 RepID=UPI003C3F0A02
MIANSAGTHQSLDGFIATCRTLIENERPIAEITRAMEELVAEPAALGAQIPEPVISPDTSIAGVDEILFEDDSLTVFVVHSASDVRQPPHDHRISAVIGVYEGTEEQRYFRRDGGSLVRSGGADIGPGDVLTLGPAAIHAIGSTGSWCRAIHVYLGPLSSIDRSLFDPDTFDEEPMTVERYAEFCRSAVPGGSVNVEG